MRSGYRTVVAFPRRGEGERAAYNLGRMQATWLGEDVDVGRQVLEPSLGRRAARRRPPRPRLPAHRLSPPVRRAGRARTRSQRPPRRADVHELLRGSSCMTRRRASPLNTHGARSARPPVPSRYRATSRVARRRGGEQDLALPAPAHRCRSSKAARYQAAVPRAGAPAGRRWWRRAPPGWSSPSAGRPGIQAGFR